MSPETYQAMKDGHLAPLLEAFEGAAFPITIRLLSTNGEGRFSWCQVDRNDAGAIVEMPDGGSGTIAEMPALGPADAPLGVVAAVFHPATLAITFEGETVRLPRLAPVEST